MKVLLINGSPHQKGCTYTALEETAQALEAEGVETELFQLGAQPIGGCTGCGGCAAGGGCVLGGRVNEFLEKAAGADGFVFGSPVHFAGAAGNLIAFMDRAFYAGTRYRGNVLRYKPAACVLSARRAGTTAAFDQLNKYFTIREMPVVSSRYWNMVHGNTPEEVRQDLEGLYTMRVLGRNMAWLLRCIAASRAAGVPLPRQEESVSTNFIR